MPDGPYPIKRAGLQGEVTRGKALARPRRVDDDGPTPDDLERFGGVTRTCPSCGKEVYDDAVLCYHCGHAMERQSGPRIPKVWVVVVVMVLIALLVGVALR